MKESWSNGQKSVIILLVIVLIGIIFFSFEKNLFLAEGDPTQDGEEHDCEAEQWACVAGCGDQYELGTWHYQQCIYDCVMAHDQCQDTVIPTNGGGKIDDQVIIQNEILREDCIDAGGTYCPIRGCDSGFDADQNCGGIANCCAGPCRSIGGDRPQWLIECMIRLSSDPFYESPPGLGPGGGGGPPGGPGGPGGGTGGGIDPPITCHPVDIDDDDDDSTTEEEWFHWELMCILMYQF